VAASRGANTWSPSKKIAETTMAAIEVVSSAVLTWADLRVERGR
jgi:hypothetical protein